MASYMWIVIFACLHNAFGQQPIFDIHVDDLFNMQKGIGWPHSIRVVEGHELLLKLSKVLEDPEHCTITAPSGEEIDVNTLPQTRYEKWTDSCGLRVRNVVKSDEGRWRVMTSRGNDSLTGFSEVFVVDDVTTYTGDSIALTDGASQASVELTTLNNSYCVVEQPFTEGTLLSGRCHVTLDRATRAVQGNWNVLLGLPGKVSEVAIVRHVVVEAEHLDVGYVSDTTEHKLHLYCNIMNSVKNVTYCRFHRTNTASGFNVIDGLSDGSHSYYGEGFLKQQCGMTIEHPTAQDYGTWRCSVGSQAWVGAALQQLSPMQALISVAPNAISSNVVREVQEEEVLSAVFVQLDSEFTIMCHADVALAYCWFQHPNRSQFTPVPLSSEEQLFWYTGESLQIGDCGITFAHANEGDTGEWRCHMGPSNQLGIEATDLINVRVTGPLAANRPEIYTEIGQEVTLYCHTANGNKPLDYCRFLMPNFLGLSVDSSVTEELAIFDRLYFTANRSLDHGDCSLTIKSVTAEDLGVWICAALVDGNTVESRDNILLYTETIPESQDTGVPLSRAAITGMVIGALGLVTALGVFGVFYKRNKRRRLQQQQHNTGALELNERNSVSSGESFTVHDSAEGSVRNMNVVS